MWQPPPLSRHFQACTSPRPTDLLVWLVWQTEGVRPVMDYMALPPSQYSVLDEEAITRLGEDTFRYTAFPYEHSCI